MNLTNCLKCGHLIINVDTLLCNNCFKEHEKTYQKIKEFLVQNTKSTLLDVHNQTGVPIETIKILIKDKRISAL